MNEITLRKTEIYKLMKEIIGKDITSIASFQEEMKIKIADTKKITELPSIIEHFIKEAKKIELKINRIIKIGEDKIFSDPTLYFYTYKELESFKKITINTQKIITTMERL